MLGRHWAFLLVLLEAAGIAGFAVVVVARRASLPVRPAILGACAGAIPELTLPVLMLSGAIRLPVGIVAIATSAIDWLSLPGRGVALLLGHSSSFRWAVGLSDPPTAWLAQCWSLVIAGDVLFYGLAGALGGALLARRRLVGGEPHNNSLKRTRFARRLAQSR